MLPVWAMLQIIWEDMSFYIKQMFATSYVLHKLSSVRNKGLATPTREVDWNPYPHLMQISQEEQQGHTFPPEKSLLCVYNEATLNSELKAPILHHC